MYYLKYWLYSCFMFTLMVAACHKNAFKEVNLEPNDRRPIYRIQVGDGEEVQLLKQQLDLEILRMEGPNLYSFDTRGVILDTLKTLGYFIANMRKI